MTETPILRGTMLSASQAGGTVWRNNVGIASYFTLNGRRLTLGELRRRLGPGVSEQRVAYGLTPGSSDLVGLVPVVIQPGHVGARVAVFTAIETKTDAGTPTGAQCQFLSHVAASGGIAILARGENAPAAVAGLLHQSQQGHIIWGIVHDTSGRSRSA